MTDNTQADIQEKLFGGARVVPKLVPTLPDTERAEKLKATLAAAASHWCAACDAARAAGFEVQASFGPNAFGKTDITQLRLFKTY